MLRKALAVLAVAAVVMGTLAWRDRQADQRRAGVSERRFTCPDDVGATLPHPASAPAGSPSVVLTKVAAFERPVGLSSRGGDDSVYVVEQGGKVVRYGNGAATTVVDLSEEVSTGFEQGLLGLAFSPDGGMLYTNHTDLEGHTRVTEWTFDGTSASDRRDVLFVRQPDPMHNGGSLAFGSDGMLYVGLGDGGGKFDPDDRGQSLDTLLGKVLRIDPRRQGDRAYSVPEDNPFVGREGARPEIWAYGLRNPWRLSVDAGTGDLWIADVGDGCFEEIDVDRAGSKGGANYGWDRVEGDWLIDPPAPAGVTAPAYSYHRDGSTACAVVGGYVYRGTAIPDLRGWYVFGDFCNGQLMAWRGPGQGEPVPLGPTVRQVTSFGVDVTGELYVTSLTGDVSKLVPLEPPGTG